MKSAGRMQIGRSAPLGRAFDKIRPLVHWRAPGARGPIGRRQNNNNTYNSITARRMGADPLARLDDKLELGWPPKIRPAAGRPPTSRGRHRAPRAGHVNQVQWQGAPGPRVPNEQ